MPSAPYVKTNTIHLRLKYFEHTHPASQSPILITLVVSAKGHQRFTKFHFTLFKREFGQRRLSRSVLSLSKIWQYFCEERRTAAARLPGVYSTNTLYLDHADRGQLPLTLHTYSLLTATSRQWLTAGERRTTTQLCSERHVGMQFNPHVAILKIGG